MNFLRAFVRNNAFPIGLFLFLRVWTFVWASITAAFIPPSAEASKHYYGIEPLRDWLIAPWQRWDTIWYTKIALEGYAADPRIVFPPFYPLLLRGLSPFLGNNFVAAGLVLASIAALASFILLYQLARELFPAASARRALLFMGVFPTAFYLFAAYTESLFLAFVLGAFLCMRHRHWVGTGIFSGLAAMTRAQGMLVVLPFAIEFWMQYRRKEIALRQIWTLGLIVLGSVAHLGWLTFQFGSLDVWFQAQLLWHRAVLPWESLVQVWQTMLGAPSWLEGTLTAIQLGAELLLLGAIVWSARRLSWSYTAYAAIIALPSLFVVTTYSSQFPLTGVSRFAILAFPLFLLLGALRKRWWHSLLIAGSFLLQTLWLILFVSWVFVH
ncbi:MAG: glycosyltransferase family 39 protein [Chloroflexi bacterium]|nr:glycosyltransferase family 39 protein [Chloroflexota bacterium]